jgi:hypothetical protein
MQVDTSPSATRIGNLHLFRLSTCIQNMKLACGLSEGRMAIQRGINSSLLRLAQPLASSTSRNSIERV